MTLRAFEWDDGVGMAIAALAGVLFTLALMAYRRRRTTRVLLFAAAFGALFVRGLVIVIEVLAVGDRAFLDGVSLLAELAALLLFFAGMVKG